MWKLACSTVLYGVLLCVKGASYMFDSGANGPAKPIVVSVMRVLVAARVILLGSRSNLLWG